MISESRFCYSCNSFHPSPLECKAAGKPACICSYIMPAEWNQEQIEAYIAARNAGDVGKAIRMLRDAGWIISSPFPENSVAVNIRDFVKGLT